MFAKDVLGKALVHAALAGGDAWTRIGDVQQFEQRLDGAILALGPVQSDEGDIGSFRLEPADQLGAEVHHIDIVAKIEQGLGHPLPRAQRNAAFK